MSLNLITVFETISEVREVFCNYVFNYMAYPTGLFLLTMLWSFLEIRRSNTILENSYKEVLINCFGDLLTAWDNIPESRRNVELQKYKEDYISKITAENSIGSIKRKIHNIESMCFQSSEDRWMLAILHDVLNLKELNLESGLVKSDSAKTLELFGEVV